MNRVVAPVVAPVVDEVGVRLVGVVFGVVTVWLTSAPVVWPFSGQLPGCPSTRCLPDHSPFHSTDFTPPSTFPSTQPST